jgi:hypothetical protein
MSLHISTAKFSILLCVTGTLSLRPGTWTMPESWSIIWLASFSRGGRLYEGYFQSIDVPHPMSSPFLPSGLPLVYRLPSALAVQMYKETTRSMRSVQIFYIMCFAVLLIANGYTVIQGLSMPPLSATVTDRLARSL